ncbi:thioredoxin [bacterium]|nr:thioredoxin [bacterium]
MQITDDQFSDEVLNSDQPVLVDFWASWCPPCKMMEPMVERLHDEVAESSSAKIVAVNIDRNPQTAGEYTVSSVPTFIAFKNGKPVARQTGAATENQLRNLIEQAKAA